MRIFYLSFVAALAILSACSEAGKNADTNTEADQLAELPPDPDSLRQEYTLRIKEKVDPLPTHQVREAGRLHPVDEAPLDTSFFVFRENLLIAVEQRDIFFIMEMLDEHIKSSFGDEDGIPTFVRIWELDTPEKAASSKLWEVLASVLELGGTFGEGRYRFVAPYVFSTWPEDYDAFQYGAITGRGVRLREGAGLNTRILKTISNNIVELVERTDITDTINGETHPWIKVKMPDGTEGFVYGKFFRSPIEFRAGFERGKNERWKMVFLVAGD